MDAGIGDLPVELLTAIFHRVHASSHRSLVSCMKVSQQWKNLAEPILWKNILLKLHNARRFSAQVRILRLSEQGLRKLNTVRCLRIAIPGTIRDYAGGVSESASGEKFVHLGSTLSAATVLGPGITDLVEALPLLSNLQTFQIMVYSGMRMNGPDDFLGPTPHQGKTAGICPDVFANLVDALPPNVLDLSLELSDAARADHRTVCPICPAVNRILPRLEHLALYLRTCCEHVLLPSKPDSLNNPKLKSVIMRLQGVRSKACNVQRINGGWRQADFDVHQYTARIQKVRDLGVFPSLNSFLIISKRERTSFEDRDPMRKWAVYVRDLVHNETVVFPRLFLDKFHAPNSTITRTLSPRAFIRIPNSCSFMPTWRLGKEYVGGSGSIRRLVEGFAGWEGFRFGPIIPRLRTSELQSAVEKGYVQRWYDPHTSEVYRQRSQVTCDLWTDEDAAGCRLLEPMVYKGVTNDIPLQRRVVPFGY